MSMRDHVRLAELLTGVGTIGLGCSLFALDWFGAREFSTGTSAVGGPAYAITGTIGPAGAGALGWFAYGTLLLTLAAGTIVLLGAATGGASARRGVLAPAACVISGLAFLVLGVRLFVDGPGVSADELAAWGPAGVSASTDLPGVDRGRAVGAYFGLLFVGLMYAGAWLSMRSQHTRTGKATARDAAPLSDVAAVPTRRSR